ncbi:hypothetical protein CRE_03672 [Caenorhabditis remanei]|uniref:Copper transport protein n=1 Tax=Caenorhabditis remanei TaxID=31234 RepID=E3LXL7_CAERE|nr:hypothetical protein CRE_03672 [Caenorhabditis remanei]
MNMNSSTMSPGGMTTKMWQWYHIELNDVILFEEWKVRDSGTMVWSCFVVGFAGVLLEFLKYSSWMTSERMTSDMADVDRRTKYGGIVVPSKYRNKQCALFQIDRKYLFQIEIFRFWSSHIIQSFYHFWQTLLAFILMNIYMTFNIYICLSLCLGLSIGHFFFGSRIH